MKPSNDKLMKAGQEALNNLAQSLAVKPEPSFKLVIEKEISMHQMENLLCSALEGGSNYWYLINKSFKPKNFKNTREGEEKFTHLSYPMNEGGALSISVMLEVDEDQSGKEYTLNLEALQKGMKIMAEKYPHHFSDFLADNDDSTTGDVFLQCALFGEILYS